MSGNMEWIENASSGESRPIPSEEEEGELDEEPELSSEEELSRALMNLRQASSSFHSMDPDPE